MNDARGGYGNLAWLRSGTPRLVLFLLLFAAAPAAAQGSDSLPPPPEVAQMAPVIVDGVALFRVRGSSSYPPSRRASDISGRIAAAAADRTVNPDSLLVQPVELGLSLVVQGRQLAILVESDARSEGLTLPELAVTCRLRIREAIQNYRRDRESGRTLRSVLLVSSVGLALTLGLLFMIRGTRRAESVFASRYRLRAEEVQTRTFQLINAERIWWLLRSMTAGARTLTVIVVVYAFLQWALDLFPWTRFVGRTLLRLVSDPVQIIVRNVLGYLPELFFLAIMIILCRWTLRGIRLFCTAVESGRIVLREFDREWAEPTYRIVRFVVLALFVVVAYPYIPGSDSGAFKGVSLLLGLLVSLGSSSVIANVVAGYTIIYRRAFRVGDRIRVGGHLGDVIAMRPFGVSLRTPKNEQIILPNSEIMNSPITNYSALAREHGLILHTTAGIGYETPWRQVEAMLLMAAERTDGQMPGSRPFVLQTNLGDFCITYELNVFCTSAQQMATVYSDLHRNILDVFNEYGVQIMTPNYEGDPETPKVVPREHLHDSPAVPPLAPADS